MEIDPQGVRNMRGLLFGLAISSVMWFFIVLVFLWLF